MTPDVWWIDPKLWVTAAGILGQAFIVWWRVGEQGRDIREAKEDIESLREWRAQVREQIRQLQKRPEDED